MRRQSQGKGLSKMQIKGAGEDAQAKVVLLYFTSTVEAT